LNLPAPRARSSFGPQGRRRRGGNGRRLRWRIPEQAQVVTTLLDARLLPAIESGAMWTTLRRDIIACTACPRLVAHRERVAREKRRQYRDDEYWGRPLPGFGDPRARLLVVGLAPAAHGGNRTGRMFTGDSSGDWLARALHQADFANQTTSTRRDDGLTLRDAYITAAVRCAPPDNKPVPKEFAACRGFLIRELALLRRVSVVVALGRLAFDAYLAARSEMGLAAPKPRPAFAHGAAHPLPDGVTLIASYHPSRQNTQTGRLTRPMLSSVFRSARRALERPRAARRPSR
jgi:uracil-DNA glycosylase family 4